MTILFIDDDRANYLKKYVEELCIKKNYDLGNNNFVFIDRLDKLKTLDINDVMLAFLDIDLNDKYNGIDVAKMLVSINKHIKIVFVSAFAENYQKEIETFKDNAFNSYLTTISKRNRVTYINEIIAFINKQVNLINKSRCVIYLDGKINENLIINKKLKANCDDSNAFKFNSLTITIDNKKIIIKDKTIERTIRLILFIMANAGNQQGDELKETASKYLEYLTAEGDKSGISDDIDYEQIKLKLSHLRHLVSKCNHYFKKNYGIDNFIVGAGESFVGCRVEFSKLYKFNKDVCYLPLYDENEFYLDDDLDKIINLFRYCYSEVA